MFRAHSVSACQLTICSRNGSSPLHQSGCVTRGHEQGTFLSTVSRMTAGNKTGSVVIFLPSVRRVRACIIMFCHVTYSACWPGWSAEYICTLTQNFFIGDTHPIQIKVQKNCSGAFLLSLNSPQGLCPGPHWGLHQQTLTKPSQTKFLAMPLKWVFGSLVELSRR